MIPDLTPAEVARFYSKIRVAGCGMRWDGEVNNHGYGRFTIYRGVKRVRILTHRLSYKLATGIDPGRDKIRHRCDTPPCVTPDCLEPGTQADNIRDAVSRGRMDVTGLTAFREALIAGAAERVNAAEKLCSRCGHTKPMTEFARNRSTVDGRAYWCKACIGAWGLSERERRRLKRDTAAPTRKAA
jgi:hypothetical protein